MNCNVGHGKYEARNKRNRERYASDPEFRAAIKARSTKYLTQNKDRAAEYRKRSKERNPEGYKEWRKRSYEKNKHKILSNRKAKVAILKDDVFSAYGNRCRCCGESNMAFLAMDHVENDGAAHRASGVAPGKPYCKYLKDNGYPISAQILCHNCNWAKSRLGGCPHGMSWRSMTVNA